MKLRRTSTLTASPHSSLEKVAVAQVIVLLIASSWALGGNSVWSETLLIWLGLPAIGVTIADYVNRFRAPGRPLRTYFVLVPWILYSSLIVSSLFTASLRPVRVEGAEMLVPSATPIFLPSSARPGETLRSLLLANAMFLPAFNLLTVVRSRRALRFIFTIFVANAAILAVFGTLQKLSGATGIFFGSIPSPNKTFFASFIYHNHWGAFALLATALCVGLVGFYSRHAQSRGFFQSPAFAGVVLAILLAASIPLSSSRSCTALVTIFIFGALIHGLVALRRRAMGSHAVTRHRWLPMFIVGAALGTSAMVFKLAEPVLRPRIEQTRAQLTEIRQTGSIGARAQLYRDTWSMTVDRPWFGWGLGTYGTAFSRYNSGNVGADGLPHHYEDAHSDWLQSLAETGFVGTALKLLTILLPFVLLRRSGLLFTPPSTYALTGCSMIALYAWIEFPFGNGAVVFATWALYLGAVRLAELEQRERSP